MRTAAGIPITLLCLALVGCGEEVPVTSNDPSAGADRRYTAITQVLQSPEHGPQLCLGGQLDSLPPQCGGPDVIGWNWAAVEGAESLAGTTWGSYTVVGTYDGERFTLTEPATTPDEDPGGGSDSGLDPSTPCDPPADGWQVVNPATTTLEAREAAAAYAAAQPDFAGLWVDQSINPALADGFDAGDELVANDPAKLVLNIRFTGDVERHGAELRAMWGGSLCVSEAERTEAELLAIQSELNDLEGMLGTGADPISGQVEVTVIVDDGLQERLDERYGKGVVHVHAALTPLD